MRRTAEIVIIGGGLAGAAAACGLAAAGRSVLLLEREARPHHKVCGEFLSVEAVASLERLGLDLVRLGAERIGTARLACGAAMAETRLPFAALSLSRRILDEALLERARTLGAVVRRGIAVRGLEIEGRQARVLSSDGGDVRSDVVLLASGKRDLRGWARPAPSGGGPIGFKMHFHLRPAAVEALRSGVEIHLFRGGYAGLQLVEDGLANLCLVLDRSLYVRLKDWSGVLAHAASEGRLLGERLADAQACWTRPLATAQIPYGYVHGGDAASPVWRLGDQAAVTPSFTGDGMAIALHSARLAAAMLASGETACAFQEALRRDVGGQVGRSMGLAWLLEAPGAAGIAVGLARLAPNLLSAAAQLTRLPSS